MTDQGSDAAEFVYILGCALQDLEGRVLQLLDIAERARKKTPKN